jgi:hypothetical protein
VRENGHRRGWRFLSRVRRRPRFFPRPSSCDNKAGSPRSRRIGRGLQSILCSTSPMPPNTRARSSHHQSVHHARTRPACPTAERGSSTGTTRSPARTCALARAHPPVSCVRSPLYKSVENGEGVGMGSRALVVPVSMYRRSPPHVPRCGSRCPGPVASTGKPVNGREWVNQQIYSTEETTLVIVKIASVKEHKVCLTTGYAAFLFFLIGFPFLLKHKHQHYSCKVRIVSF